MSRNRIKDEERALKLEHTGTEFREWAVAAALDAIRDRSIFEQLPSQAAAKALTELIIKHYSAYQFSTAIKVCQEYERQQSALRELIETAKSLQDRLKGHLELGPVQRNLLLRLRELVEQVESRI